MTRVQPPALVGKIASGDSIRIGFAVPRAEDIGGAIGATLPMPDSKPLILALIDHVNETGGFGGRKVVPIIREYDFSVENQTPSTQSRIQNEICTALTEDDRVFIAIGLGSVTSYGTKCYYDHHTPFWSTHPYNLSMENFRNWRPWVLPTIYPPLEELAKRFPSALARWGFMGKRLGILSADLPVYKQSLERILIPGIEALGGSVRKVVFWHEDSVPQAVTDIAAAVTIFRNQVDVVIVWDTGGGGWTLFTQGAESQGFRPDHYALVGTLSAPDVWSWSVPSSHARITKAFGLSPLMDVADEAFPPTSRERFCWEIAGKRTGEKYVRSYRPSNEGKGGALLIQCDHILTLQKAFEPTSGKSVDADEVYGLLRDVGTSFQPFTVNSADYGRGIIGSVSSWADVGYLTHCACFGYTSPWNPLSEK